MDGAAMRGYLYSNGRDGMIARSARPLAIFPNLKASVFGVSRGRLFHIKRMRRGRVFIFHLIGNL